MRGKKIDNIFVGDFIAECVKHGKTYQNEIVEEARTRISSIDKQIQEVEKLKITRSKLMDVILSFDKKKPALSSQDDITLNFFKIDNQTICKYICDLLKKNPLTMEQISKSKFDYQDILFTLKQLLENNIIVKENNNLFQGKEFKNFLKIVFLED